MAALRMLTGAARCWCRKLQLEAHEGCAQLLILQDTALTCYKALCLSKHATARLQKHVQSKTAGRTCEKRLM